MSLDHWITGGDNPGRAWEQHREGDVPPDSFGRCLCGEYAGTNVKDTRGYLMCLNCQQLRPQERRGVKGPAVSAVGK